MSAQDTEDDEEEDFMVAVDELSVGVPEKSASQESKLVSEQVDLALDIKELCKTPEGRNVMLKSEPLYSVIDQELQWKGMRANRLPTEATFPEYQMAQLLKRCANLSPLGYFEMPVAVPTPKGTCDNIYFGKPEYDPEGTVERIREFKNDYANSTEPWVGTTREERDRNLNTRVAQTLFSIESNLKLYYRNTTCMVAQNADCAGHTGQKKVCDKTYIHAPPYQAFEPNTFETGRHIKQGPVLQSPTLAWFRVGATGHRHNFSFVALRSRFTEEGAKTKAQADVDVIRRKLVAAGLPVDRIPPQPETKKPETPTPTQPQPKPARISVSRQRRAPDSNYYDVVWTNSGGTQATIHYRIWYWDNFYSSRPAEPKVLIEDVVVVPAGEAVPREFHNFHAQKFEYEALDQQ